MAYDLAFWTDTRAERPEPSVVYRALLRGDTVDGLSHFDAHSALRSMAAHLPRLEVSHSPSGQAFWESSPAGVVFEFSWSPQHLLATARGAFTNDQMNAVIDACIAVGGRLYDPQTNERFEG